MKDNYYSQIIKAEPFTHLDKKFVLIVCSNSPDVQEYMEKLEGIRWSKTRKQYYLDYDVNVLKRIFNHVMQKKAWYLDYSAFTVANKKTTNKPIKIAPASTKLKQKPLSTEQGQELIRFKKWMQNQRYAENSIRSYINNLDSFFRYFSDKKVDEIGKEELFKYNAEFIIPNGISPSYQNQTISSIKTYYLKMRGIQLEFEDFERPRKYRALPKVIAIEQVQKSLFSIINLKHKTALSTIYALGLRRSELLHLRIADMDFSRNVISIRNAKGQKDRDLPMPLKLKSLLQNYLAKFNPKEWLIEGSEEGKRYSETSLQNIFNKYFGGKEKNTTFTTHSLRHSYATHLMDAGVDLRIIQELLGHKSSKTTEIYTHVSMRKLQNVQSPIEGFDL